VQHDLDGDDHDNGSDDEAILDTGHSLEPTAAVGCPSKVKTSECCVQASPKVGSFYCAGRAKCFLEG
jgi:hypothetical protein